ncbi:putative cytochrome P450 [Colletotrichum sublineola]|uniref:Putative cytochrome P450 n=1 Tax=Colletotrichum sublineola TaxID=1173701 RepID=A0A066Y154_COLSU|nr:putative cytochrome P450 [Colletotrichum sublineola]
MSILQLVADESGYSSAVVIIGASIISLVAFTFGTVVYRLWFHPLAKIPGPKLWATCDVFNMVHQQVKLDMAYRAIELHRKYGPMVRIGPNRVIVEGNIAWPQVHGARSTSEADELGKVKNFLYPIDHMALLGANREDHRRQRRQLGHAFSIAALHEQEHIIQKFMGQFIDELTARTKRGETLNIVDWINYTTFDVIGDLCFAECFHGLDGDTDYVDNAFRGVIGSSYTRFLKRFPLLKVPMKCVLGTNELAKAIEAGKRNASLGQLRGKARMAMGAEPKDGRRDFATYMLKEGKNGEKVLSEGEVLEPDRQLR